MNNFLVATDFSAEAGHALHLAQRIAQRTGADLTLLHVAVPSGPGAPITAENLAAAREKLHALRQHTQAAAPGLSIKTIIETGEPDECILAVADQLGASLLLLGTQAAGAFKRLGFSGRAERLVRLSLCPVLTVKAIAPDYAVRRIIFAADFTPETERAAFGLAYVLALYPDAVLHLLFVAAPGKNRGDVQERISAFSRRHQLPRATAAVVEASSPALGICRFAERTAADLVVLATRGRTGLGRLTHSSVAEQVAGRALPPVLTFPFAPLG